MKKKLLLMTFMVLMGAMASWAGQVYVNNDPSIDHGNIGVDNYFPAPGATVTLSVVPDGGYFLYSSDIVIEEHDALDNFVCYITPSGPPEAYGQEFYTFVMPNDVTHDVHVTATFTGLEYPVNIMGGVGGSFCVSHINSIPIDPNTWNGQARTGDIVTLTATPDLGWELDYYSVFAPNDNLYLPVTTVDPVTGEFMMQPSPVDIEAFFRMSDYEITIDLSNGDGSIDVSKIAGNVVPPGTPQPYYAKMGDGIELIITPDPGYELDYIDLIADDPLYDQVLNGDVESFGMPPSNITLVPKFRLATVTLTVDVVSGSGSVRTMPRNPGAGAVVRLVVTPDPGYMLPSGNMMVEQRDNSDVVQNTYSVDPYPDIWWDDPSPPYPTTTFTMPVSPPYNVHLIVPFDPVMYPVDCNPPAVGGTFKVSLIDGQDPVTDLGYGDPRHVQAHIGQVITLTNTPASGYQFIQYIATYQQNGSDVPITINSNGQFTMPPGPVTIQAVFKHAYTLDLTQNVLGGTLYVQTINSNTPPPGPSYTVYEGDVVEVDCRNVPVGYDVDHYELKCDDGYLMVIPGTPATFVMPNYTTDTYCDFIDISVVYKPKDYRIDVRQPYEGDAQAQNQNTLQMGTNIVGNYGHVIQLFDFPFPGYELDHYEVWEVDYINTFLLYPPNPTFVMRDSRVVVRPFFRLKNYTITVDMTSWYGGLVTATNTSATPPTSATSGYMGTAPLTGPQTITNVHIGDLIQLSLIPDLTWSANSLQYYEFERTGDGYYIGGMVPSSYLPPATAYFTMPPCDLTISAVIHDSWGQWIYPPIDVQFLGARVNGGVVYLEDLIWLGKHSKSSPDEEEQNLENYGWAHAVPGEPMHFVVIPDPGYQVRKSDITVRLVEASQGEGDDESKVLKEFKSADGIEIFGPDEFVTELTEYYFIFDVPEGVDPHTVKVEIDANFIPVDYAITVDTSIEHGTITAPATANVGETVTLTVTPEPGYSLANIMVLPELPGYIVEVDSNNQFTMPACNVLVTAEFEESPFLRGDVDNDGFISISDVTVLIDYILSGDGSLINLEGADCDQDGSVNISDLTLLIDYILSGIW